MGSEAVNYTSGVEDLYQKMLVKIETLTRLIEQSSAKVLEQEIHNRKLSYKAARSAGLEQLRNSSWWHFLGDEFWIEQDRPFYTSPPDKLMIRRSLVRSQIQVREPLQIPAEEGASPTAEAPK